jgi:UDP-N-acetylmuramoyl-L-alanyl-D-glutamate--2,6-diaminopimelate ligase
MAKEAAQLSDILILTSDNPRFEDPADILHDMEAGLDTDKLRANASSIVDRREAIAKAVEIAGKGDVILIAGKGHEDYQEIRGVKHHFDDAEVVRELFSLSAK